MIAAIDNSFLTLFLNPDSPPRSDPSTGAPTPHCKEKIEGLIDTLSKQGDRLLIPAPCLAEVLCKRKSVEETINLLQAVSCVEIFPFDTKSAIELSEIIKRDKARIRTIQLDSSVSWQAVKMDLQIVAIAKSNGASLIYTDDGPQARFATLAGLEVAHTWNLPLTPERAQAPLWETDV